MHHCTGIQLFCSTIQIHIRIEGRLHFLATEHHSKLPYKFDPNYMNYIYWVKYKMYDSFESIYQELNIRLDLCVKVLPAPKNCWNWNRSLLPILEK